MGRGPGLGCCTGSWGLRKVSGPPAEAPDGPGWGEPGCAGEWGAAHLGMSWQTLAQLSWVFLPPQQRNRRGKAAGKVNCKNMKQDCPVPACPRATLLPGHCCHTCPKGESHGCLRTGTPLCTHRVPHGHRRGGTAHIPPKGAAYLVMGACQCPWGAQEVLSGGKPQWTQLSPNHPGRGAERVPRAKEPARLSACTQRAPSHPSRESCGDLQGTSHSVLRGGAYYSPFTPRALEHKQPGAMVPPVPTPCQLCQGPRRRTPLPPSTPSSTSRTRRMTWTSPTTIAPTSAPRGWPATMPAQVSHPPGWAAAAWGTPPIPPAIINIPSSEFVALLTSGPEPWHPTSSAVAKAHFTLLRSYLLFSISYER